MSIASEFIGCESATPALDCADEVAELIDALSDEVVAVPLSACTALEADEPFGAPTILTLLGAPAAAAFWNAGLN